MTCLINKPGLIALKKYIAGILIEDIQYSDLDMTKFFKHKYVT